MLVLNNLYIRSKNVLTSLLSVRNFQEALRPRLLVCWITLHESRSKQTSFTECVKSLVSGKFFQKILSKSMSQINYFNLFSFNLILV